MPFNRWKFTTEPDFRFWPKLTKIEENLVNPNRLVKLSEICYVDAFQQKKIQQKNIFSISAKSKIGLCGEFSFTKRYLHTKFQKISSNGSQDNL